MSYDKQTWADGPGGATPLSAGRLSHMEDGIADAAMAGGAPGITEDTVAPDGSGNIGITYSSQFGINATTGAPYWQDTGATTGEDAWLVIDNTGALTLVQP